LLGRDARRGNHETPGTWRYGSPADDVLDLAIVVEFLKKNYGYCVDLVVGHSRGAVVAFHWLCTSEEGKQVGGFVNVAGRYRMRVSLPNNTMIGADVPSSFRRFTPPTENLR
jgi:predicted alpha/beta hydrolase family esterase